MNKAVFYAAVGTPLTESDELHVQGLEAHLNDQWQAGMTGILVAGTMGLMQLLADETYEQLVSRAVEFSAGKGQIMVGVGDTSFARTRKRIRLANQFELDGVVVLSPYLVKFSRNELISYFSSLADVSSCPLYLYDLPVLTGVKLDFETVLTLARHRNIRGIKCSSELGWARQLVDLAPPNFEVIFAQADAVDLLLRHGIRSHLDGIFALAPHWTVRIGDAAAAGNWEQAEAWQQRLSALLRVLKQYGVFPSFTAMLNARGIPGKFAPAPMAQIEQTQLRSLLAEPIVRELIENREPAVLR